MSIYGINGQLSEQLSDVVMLRRSGLVGVKISYKVHDLTRPEIVPKLSCNSYLYGTSCLDKRYLKLITTYIDKHSS